MIVAEAAEVFIENGYHRTKISTIVKRVGGSNRNIYENFGDKFGLFQAVIRGYQDRLMDGFVAAHVEHADPRTWLETFGRAYVRSSMNRATVALHRLAIAEAQIFPELGGSVLNQAEYKLSAMVAAFLTERAAVGELEVDDAAETAGALLSMLRGERHLLACYGIGELPGEAELDAHADRTVALFMKAVAPRA